MTVIGKSTHATGVGGASWYNAGGIHLEILRQFQAEQLLHIEKLVAKRLAPGEGQTAVLCRGAPSTFNFPTVQTTITTSFPNNDKPKEDDGEAAEYIAVWWETEDVRVENPEDSNQYVITKRILQVRYRRPDGSEVKLDNRPIFATFPAGA